MPGVAGLAFSRVITSGKAVVLTVVPAAAVSASNGVFFAFDAVSKASPLASARGEASSSSALRPPASNVEAVPET